MASSIISAPAQSISPVRPLNVARDMPQVMRLLNRVFSPTLDAEGRRALNSMSNQPSLVLRINQLGQKIAPGFVYEDRKNIIGNVSIIPTAIRGRLIIANVAVHEEHRRRGIARHMMEATVEHLTDRGAKTIMLQVDVENDGARVLYEDLGFKVMGSTTYWGAAPNSWRELSTVSHPDIRPLRPSEYRKAYTLDSATFPIDLNWPDPIDRNTYRMNLLRRLDHFLNGKSVETWVIAEGENLLGLGSIWSEWGRPHRLTIRTLPECRDEILPALFGKMLRRLNYARRRHATIEHPMDDELMNEMLVAANFYARRNLTTMRLDVA